MPAPWERYAAPAGPWAKYNPPTAPVVDAAPAKSPGYAKARATEDELWKKRPLGFTDAMIAPLADELSGGAAALTQLVKNAPKNLTGRPVDTTVGEAYGAAADSAKSALSDYAQAHPGRNLGAQALGGLMMGPARGAPAITSLKQAIGVGGKQGAVAGGLYGAASGEGLRGRAESTVKGAGIGGATGLAIPVGIKGAGMAVKGISDLSRGALRTMGVGAQTTNESIETALDYLAKTFKRDQTTPAQIKLALHQGRKGNMTIADVGGENTVSALRTAAQSPGVARNIVTKFANERQAGQRERIAEGTKAAFGSTDTYGQAATIKAARGAEANTDFGAALGKGIVRSKPLSSLFQSPTMKSAIGYAQKIAGDEYALARAEGRLGAADTEDWAKAVSDLPSKTAFPARYLHHLKQGLDAHLESFRDPITKKINYSSPEVAAADKIRKAFRNEVKTLNPRYAEALDKFSSKSRLLTAQRDGEVALRLDPEEIRTLTGTMTSAQERTQFKVGFGRALQDMIERTGDKRNAANQLIGNEAMRKRISAVLGRDSATYVRGLLRETRKFETGASLGGSQTTPRAMDEADMAGHTAVSALRSGLRSGGVRNAMDAAAAWMARRYDSVSGMTEETKEIIARALISEDQGLQSSALRALEELQKKPTKHAPYLPGGVTGAVTNQAYGNR